MSDLSVFKKEDEQNEENLKGTFISVLGIGAFIVLFWVMMFYIYITRL